MTRGPKRELEHALENLDFDDSGVSFRVREGVTAPFVSYEGHG